MTRLGGLNWRHAVECRSRLVPPHQILAIHSAIPLLTMRIFPDAPSTRPGARRSSAGYLRRMQVLVPDKPLGD
jgi:hypothetical protein